MDIFEEIKEAVLSATPGEDTRNYYRNQGMKIEKERIIKLLLDTYQVRLSDGSRVPSNHNDSLDETIALIKGEK